MSPKQKEPKYEPNEDYVITAKFQKKGHEIETFLEKLKNSFVMWVEVNKGRYFNKEEK